MNASFQTTLTVDRTPQEVFAAINEPQVWWNELIDGSAEAIGDEFAFNMPGVTAPGCG